MIAGTCGPGDGAAWGLTPGSAAFLAGGGVLSAAGQHHRVTAWQLNTARPGRVL